MTAQLAIAKAQNNKPFTWHSLTPKASQQPQNRTFTQPRDQPLDNLSTTDRDLQVLAIYKASLEQLWRRGFM